MYDRAVISVRIKEITCEFPITIIFHQGSTLSLCLGYGWVHFFFFYDSEGNRLFYMITMLVFVFSGFLFCYIYLLHGDLRTCLWKLLNLFGWVGSWFQNSLCQNWPMLSHVREVLDKIVFSCLFWTVYVLFSFDFTFCSYL